MDQRVDFRIDCVPLHLNLLQAGSVLALEKGQRDGFDPGLGRDLILDQGVARRAQIPEIIDEATWYGPYLQRQNRPHPREHCRIKRIGFGEVWTCHGFVPLL